MKKLLRITSIAILLFALTNKVSAQITISGFGDVTICPDNQYYDLDSIIIREGANGDFANNETGVNYKLFLPTNIKFEPFTGVVEFFPNGNFTNTSLLVSPDSLTITYDISSSNGNIDSILIHGLRIRSNVAGLALTDVIRGGTADHSGGNNDPADALSHGRLGTGTDISTVVVTPTPVQCNDSTDGELAIAVTGGTAPYSYSLDFGSTFPFNSSPITNLSPGGYFVIVQDATGCSANATGVSTISEPAAISVSSSSFNNITCNGDGDGDLTVTLAGGTGAITFATNGVGAGGPYANSSGANLSGLAAGTYDIFAEDASGCPFDAPDITIIDPAALVELSATKTNITCNGNNDGIIVAVASGGTGAINFSTSGIGGPYSTANGTQATGLTPGTKNIFYEDANGCQVAGSTLNIINPPVITINAVNKTDITCNGDGDGSITALASGGTGAINFSIDGSTTVFPYNSGQTVTGLADGNYSVVFEDGNGCQTAPTNLTIIEPTALESPTASFQSAPTVSGGFDGQITINIATTGTPSYLYSVNNGTTFQNSNSFNTLGFGTYTLTLQDANGCQNTGSIITFSDPGSLNPGIVSFNGRQDTTVCNGSTATLVIQSDDAATGSGVNYRWQESSNGVSWTDIGGGSGDNLTYNVNGPHTTQRYFRRRTTQSGDQAFSNVVRIIINNGDAVAVSVPDPTICVESPNQNISGFPVPVGAAIGAFSLVSGTGLTDFGDGTAEFDPTVAGPFTIQYDYTNAFGCVSSNTKLITVNENTGVTISGPTIYFETDPGQVLTGNPTGGTFSGPGVSGNQFFPATVGAGTYNLFYNQTDANGCVDGDTLNVTVNTTGAGTISGLDASYCVDQASVVITGFPDAGGNPLGFVDQGTLIDPIDSTTATLNPNYPPGTYTIVFRFLQGFSLRQVTQNVTINALPVFNIVSPEDTFCFSDPTINIQGSQTNGLTTTFSGAGITDNADGTALFNAQSAGINQTGHTISYLFEDNNGCQDVANINFVVNPIPFPTISGLPASYCSNEGSDTLIGFPTPDGTTTFGNFTGNALSSLSLGSVTFDPSTLTLGNQSFTYSYTNIFGCENDTTYIRNVALTPTATISGLSPDYCVNNSDPVLTGGSNQAGGSGIFIGLGSANGSINSLNGTVSISTLSPASYTFGYVYTATSGCFDTATASTVINPLPIVSLSLGDTSFCIDDSPYNFTGSPVRSGTDIISYSGNAVSQIGVDGRFDPIAAGISTVNITYVYTRDYPTNNCIDSASQAVTVNALPTVDFSFIDPDNGNVITDLKFCKNQDSIVLRANQTGSQYAYFGNNGALVSNTISGEGTFNPFNSITSPVSKSIRYEYMSDTTGCSNNITKTFDLNPLPTGFTYTGVSNNERFCTKDDSVLLAGSIANDDGFGTFRLDPVSGPFSGGLDISGIGQDSAYFKPNLQPNTNYTLWYRFTDTLTGCQDSINRNVIINPLPNPRIRLNSAGVASQTIFSGASNTYNICTNGDFIEFEGQDNVSNLSFSKYAVIDTASPSAIVQNISGTDTSYRFIPSLTNALGNRMIQYSMTSDLGCDTSFNFLVNVLDTPSLSLIFDSTFLASTGNVPEVCKNVDSVLVNTNASMIGWGSLSVIPTSPALNSSIVSDANSTPNNDTSIYLFPSLINPFTASKTYNLRYEFTETGTNRQCKNEIIRSIKVNPLPTGFGYVSDPLSDFAVPEPGINEFCTETPNSTLTAFGVNGGLGFFKLDPKPSDTLIGGVFPLNPADSIYQTSAIFSSALKSGSDYQLRYIYTDTTTGCTDSIFKNVRIQAQPSLGVQYRTNPLSATQLFNNSNNTAAFDICTNGDPIYLTGFDSLNQIASNELVFVDTTDQISIDFDTVNQSYVFYPKRTSVSGLHSIRMTYSSNIGCQDVFQFEINVLDTPSLEVILDTTVLSIVGNNPELCVSVDTLRFTPFSSLLGNGTLSISKVGSPNNDLNFDTLSAGTNDTLLLAFPSQLTNTLTSVGNYLVNYNFIETVSSRACQNAISRPFRINPNPVRNFVAQNNSLEFCEYDLLDTLIGLNNTNLDTGYYKGIGITNIANFSASFDPSVLTPAATDQGSTDSILYVFQDNNTCVDSVYRAFTIHPKPSVSYFLQDPGGNQVSTNQFCLSETAPVQIIISQNVGTLSNSSIERRFTDLTLPSSAISFRPSSFNLAGSDTLSVIWESDAGCIDTASQPVYFYNNPEAGFIVNNFCLIDPISLTDTSTIVSGVGNLPDSINSWSWRFSNRIQDTSGIQSPSFDYNIPALGQGSYTINLTVKNTIGCSNMSSQNIFIGAPPVATFNFDNICEDSDVVFEDLSSNDGGVITKEWRISDFPFDANNLITTISSAVSDSTAVYQFADPGAYDIMLFLDTDYGCRDSSITRIDVRQIWDLANNNVYFDDFENDTLDWRPRSFNGILTWEQAIPTGNRINTGPPTGGSTVWVTNPVGEYLLNEKSYVEGPCFNFSETKRPMISFDYFSDVQATAGAVLQYSIDRGQTWVNIGQLNTGIEWYNASPIAGNPGNQNLGQFGWSKLNSGWVEARHSLDQLRNRQSVRLRIAFGADANIPAQGAEGFAFSNIRIQERDKLVLLEHFTNIGDQDARQGDITHNGIMENHQYDALDIQFHTDFPSTTDPINTANPLEQNARSFFYGISDVPRTRFEGNQYAGSVFSWAASPNILSNGKHKLIEDRILQNSKFEIDLDVNRSSTGINGNAIFRSKYDFDDNQEFTAYVVVTEKEVDPTAYTNVPQNVVFKNVFRKFLPSASGTNVTTIDNPGDAVAVAFNWNFGTQVIQPDSVFIFAFIQDFSTREVYQVATNDTSNIYVPTNLNEVIASKGEHFRVYPNPTTGRAIIAMGEVSESPQQLIIYDQLGKVVFKDAFEAGVQNKLIDLEGLSSGVYIVQLTHPIIGTTKIKLVLNR